MGTETIGFYGEEESSKQREYAADAPFTARSSQSDPASLEQKNNLELESPEAIAALSWCVLFFLTKCRELRLMQSQLEFETLLKQRYLQQIARLQRKEVLQSTSDAEVEHYVFTYPSFI
jgi:hypothetical protein